MKQNLTLSIEKDLIRKARIIAAQRGTSVSGMLSQELKRIIEDSEKYELAMKEALTYLKTGFHLGGKITASRDELHDR